MPHLHLLCCSSTACLILTCPCRHFTNTICLSKIRPCSPPQITHPKFQLIPPWPSIRRTTLKLTFKHRHNICNSTYHFRPTTPHHHHKAPIQSARRPENPCTPHTQQTENVLHQIVPWETRERRHARTITWRNTVLPQIRMNPRRSQPEDLGLCFSPFVQSSVTDLRIALVQFVEGSR